MATIAQNLETLNEGLNDIKENLGLNSNASLANVVTKSGSVVEPTGTLQITSNNTYDVTNYASAEVNVSGGGGTVDWTDYYGTSIKGSANSSNGKTEFVKLIKKIPVRLIPESTSIKYTFNGLYNLTESPDIDMTNVSVMSYAFFNCLGMTSVRQYDTSNVTGMQYAFGGCASLVNFPSLDTSKVKSFEGMFANCTNLENVPIFDFSAVTGNSSLNAIYSQCYKLTDTSLDNILQSCITVTNSYTDSKTLSTLGFDNAHYSASRIQALPHYQDFVNAGWSIGY